jgi:hypothetical protein
MMGIRVVMIVREGRKRRVKVRAEKRAVRKVVRRVEMRRRVGMTKRRRKRRRSPRIRNLSLRKVSLFLCCFLYTLGYRWRLWTLH